MTNVLGAQENAVGEIFEKYARLDQACHRLEPEAADRLDCLIHFAQLWNSIIGKIQALDCLEIFSAGMLLMRWTQRFPNYRPNLMFFPRVGSIRNGIARVVLHCD